MSKNRGIMKYINGCRVKNDLTGKIFGKLKVLRLIGLNKDNASIWECQCECGNIKPIRGTCLTRKTKPTISCGCQATKVHTVHGGCKTRLYYCWNGMIQRCKNKNDTSYKNYGGRGIKIYDEWHIFKNFQKWALENSYNDNLTLDRINNNNNYEPSNCRWTNRQVQANNTRSNRLITYNGIIKTMSEWARYYNISVYTLSSRLKRHPGNLEYCLTFPVKKIL